MVDDNLFLHSTANHNKKYQNLSIVFGWKFKGNGQVFLIGNLSLLSTRRKIPLAKIFLFLQEGVTGGSLVPVPTHKVPGSIHPN